MDPVPASPDPTATTTSAPEPAAGAEPERTRRRPGVWAQLRPLILRLHFYAGVLVGPFILVAAVSGLLYVWTPQVEQVLYQDLLRVPAAEQSLPLGEQVRLAEAKIPGSEVDSVRPATTPEDSTWVHLSLPGDDADPHSSTQTTVFVDPHRGEVLGVSESYGTSGALPVRTWIDLLHRELVRRHVPLDARSAGAEACARRMADALREVTGAAELRERSVLGVSVAVPGLIDSPSGTVTRAPNLGWREVPLRELLRSRLSGSDLADATVLVDNDANLGAMAEYRFGPLAGLPDLVYVTGEVGIGERVPRHGIRAQGVHPEVPRGQDSRPDAAGVSRPQANARRRIGARRDPEYFHAVGSQHGGDRLREH